MNTNPNTTALRRLNLKGWVALICLLAIALGGKLPAQLHYGSLQLQSGSIPDFATLRPHVPNQKIRVGKREMVLRLDMGSEFPLGINSGAWSVTLTGALQALNAQNNVLDTWPINLVSNRLTPEVWAVIDFTPISTSVAKFRFTGLNYQRSSFPITADPSRLILQENSEIGYDHYDANGNSEIVPLNLVASATAPVGRMANVVTFSWELPGSGLQFDKYDLEVLKVEPDKTGSVAIDWNKASTIEVEGGNRSYSMTIAEGTGFYFWRVRGVGTYFPGGRSDHRNPGLWSGPSLPATVSGLYSVSINGPMTVPTPNNSGLAINSTSPGPQSFSVPGNKFYYYQFDENINWIYGKVLTEGSRQSEKMTFANGLSQVQQQQTKLFSESYVMGTQSAYDYSGRPAVQSLPAPVDAIDRAVLGYRPYFFQNAQNQPFGAKDFDDIANTPQNEIFSPNGLAAPNPSLRSPNTYYSQLNADGRKADYVPDAKGRPYTQAMFYNDATGRVYKQAGPGDVMRLRDEGNASHNVLTSYGGVSQTELNRMFGLQAPKDSTVYKVVARDPNGVESVQYISNKGAVLATALGASPKAVPALLDVDNESTNPPRFAVRDVLPHGIHTTGEVLDHVSKTIVLQALDGTPTPTYSQLGLEYNFTPSKYGISCENICWTCDYTIDISVTAPMFPNDCDKNLYIRFTIPPLNLWNSQQQICNTLNQTYSWSALYNNFGGSASLVGANGAPPCLLTGSNLSTGTLRLPAGTYKIEKRVRIHNQDPAHLPQTYLDGVAHQLELERLNWTATDNCCGPIVPPTDGWDCEALPEACDPLNTAAIAAEWFHIFQREQSAPGYNNVLYKNFMQPAPSSGNYSQATFAQEISAWINAGNTCENIYNCLAMAEQRLEQNILAVNSGWPALPTGGLPGINGNGYDSRFDVLLDVRGCLGYPATPPTGCAAFQSVVFQTSNANPTSTPPVRSVYVGSNSQGQANLNLAVNYFHFPANVTYPYTPSQADTRMGMSLATATQALCNVLAGGANTTQLPGITSLQMLNESIEFCKRSCENSSTMFDQAIDNYVAEYNATELPVPAYSPSDPNWKAFADVFGAQTDNGCLVEAMVADCKSLCDMPATRTVLANASVGGNNSGLPFAQAAIEQQNMEMAITATHIVRNWRNTYANGYQPIHLMGELKRMAKFLEESIAAGVNRTRNITNPVPNNGSVGNPTLFPGLPTGPTYRALRYEDNYIMAVPNTFNYKSVKAVVHVVWATTDFTDIKQINAVITCQKGNNSQELMHWSFTPGTQCTYFRQFIAGSFRSDLHLVDFDVDQFGVMHALNVGSPCIGTLDVVGMTQEAALLLGTVDVASFFTNQSGPTLNIELYGPQGTSLGYLTQGSVTWGANPVATATALAAAINSANGPLPFTATNLNAQGTPTAIVKIGTTDLQALSYVGGQYNLQLSWNLQTAPVIVPLQQASPTFESISQSPATCSTTTVPRVTGCPFGYRTVASAPIYTMNSGSLQSGIAVGEQEIMENLIAFWSATVTEGYLLKAPSAAPRFPHPQFPYSANGFVYYEKAYDFFVKDLGTNNGKTLRFEAFANVAWDNASGKFVAFQFGLYQTPCSSATSAVSPRLYWFNLTRSNPNMAVSVPELFPVFNAPNAIPLSFNANADLFDLSYNTALHNIEVKLRPSSNGIVNASGALPNLSHNAVNNAVMVYYGSSNANSNTSFKVLKSTISSATYPACSPPPTDCQACLKWERVENPLPSDDIEIIDCDQLLEDYTANYVGSALDQCLADKIDELKADYDRSCLDEYDDEFALNYDLSFHQYTLYYYDRAGNLLKTVPPKGFVPHTATDAFLHHMETDYVYNSIKQLTSQHTPDGGTTRFWYNANGQLVLSQDAAQVPDKYSYSRYDALGRVVESGELVGFTPHITGNVVDEVWTNLAFPDLNALQQGNPAISKREVVHSEYSTPAPGVHCNGMAQENLRNRVSRSWRDEDNDGMAESSTYFSYDPHGNVKWCAADIPHIGRKTLRYEYDLVSGNVLKVVFQEGEKEQFMHRYAYDEDNRVRSCETSRDGIVWEKEANYEYYLHGPLARVTLGDDGIQGADYAYTVEGFIKAQNQAELDPAKDPGQDGKRISGGFTILGGSPGAQLRVQVDAFPAQTFTLTSTPTNLATAVAGGLSGVLGPQWQCQASGNKVIISPAGNNASEFAVVSTMGTVQITDLRNIAPLQLKDEFAMELGYYDGDYDRANGTLGRTIGGNSAATNNPALFPYAGAGFAPDNYQLFNGNIAYWTTNTRAGYSATPASASFLSLGAKVSMYKYDKLNRIRTTELMEYDPNRTLPWSDLGGSFREAFTYDRNGNILNAFRNGHRGNGNGALLGALGQLNQSFRIDALNYAYTDPTNGGFNNRLTQVGETALGANPNGSFADDLGIQPGGNYTYDAEGKLVGDASEGLEVAWNVLNKVKKVVYRNPQQQIERIIEMDYDATGQRVLKRLTTCNPANGTINGVSTTYYTYDPSGNVMAIYEGNYNPQTDETTFSLIEEPIYGSDRIGMRRRAIVIAKLPGQPGYNAIAAASTRSEMSKWAVGTGAGLSILDMANSLAAPSTYAVATNGGSYNPAIELDANESPLLMAFATRQGNQQVWQLITGTGAQINWSAPAENGANARPVFIPVPGQPSQYYLIYYPSGGGFQELKAIKVDATNYAVLTPQPIPVAAGRQFGRSVADITYADGNSRLFVYGRNAQGNGYEVYSIDVTQAGFGKPVMRKAIGAMGTVNPDNRITISPDGSLLAMLLHYSNTVPTGPLSSNFFDLAVWALDPACGTLSTQRKFNVGNGAAKFCEFSPCSGYLYVSRNEANPANTSGLRRIRLSDGQVDPIATYPQYDAEVGRNSSGQVVVATHETRPLYLVTNPSEPTASLLNIQHQPTTLPQPLNVSLPQQTHRSTSDMLQSTVAAEFNHWLTGHTLNVGTIDFTTPAPTLGTPYLPGMTVGKNVAIAENENGEEELRFFVTEAINGNVASQAAVITGGEGWPLIGGYASASSPGGILADPKTKSLIVKAATDNKNWFVITGRDGKLYYHTVSKVPTATAAGTVTARNQQLQVSLNNQLLPLEFDATRTQFALAAINKPSDPAANVLYAAVNGGDWIRLFAFPITDIGIGAGQLVKQWDDAYVYQIAPGLFGSYNFAFGTRQLDLGEMQISPDGAELMVSVTTGAGFTDKNLHHLLEKFRIDPSGLAIPQYIGNVEVANEKRPTITVQNAQQLPSLLTRRVMAFDYTPSGGYAFVAHQTSSAGVALKTNRLLRINTQNGSPTTLANYGYETRQSVEVRRAVNGAMYLSRQTNGAVTALQYWPAPEAAGIPAFNFLTTPAGAVNYGLPLQPHRMYDCQGIGRVTLASRETGVRVYELKDHLRNVRVTLGDLRGVLASRFVTDVSSWTDYYAFGYAMPGRNLQVGGYRYGFQGQEMDNEIKGTGLSLNYEYRMHDPRVGRFFAVDPLAGKYPWNSSYSFSENSVIFSIELEGLEKVIFIHSPNGTKALMKLLNDFDIGALSAKAARIEIERKITYWTQHEFVDDSQHSSTYAERKMGLSVIMNPDNFAATYTEYNKSNPNIYIIGTLWQDDQNHDKGGNQYVIWQLTPKKGDLNGEAWGVVKYFTPETDPKWVELLKKPRNGDLDGEVIPVDNDGIPYDFEDKFRRAWDSDHLFEDHGILIEDLLLDPNSDTMRKVPYSPTWDIYRKDAIIYGITKDQNETLRKNPKNAKFFQSVDGQ